MKTRIAIIGAGVVGASIARVLSQYEGLEVHLIERIPLDQGGVLCHILIESPYTLSILNH